MNRIEIEDLALVGLEPNPHHPQINIAVAGGSGSGKTTFSNKLINYLESKNIIVSLDQFFKEKSQLPKYYSKHYQKYFPDFNNPASFKITELLEYCQNISNYNFVIFDGHFALYYPELRKLMDIMVFVDADISRQLKRRTKRNLKRAYGGTKENIFNYNQECVLPAYNKYIKPSKQFANIIIDNNKESESELDKTAKLFANSLYSISLNNF